MVLWIWLVATAWPCQPLEVTSRWPTEGATDVPVNTRVYVHFLHQRSDWGRLQLVDAETGDLVAGDARNQVQGGTIGELRGGAALFLPDAPLAPDHPYVVRFTGGTVPADQQELRFVTGSELDEQPPSFAGIRAASAEFVEAGGDDTCGGPERWSFVIDAAPSPDAVSYRVLRDGFSQVGMTDSFPARVEVETGDPDGIPNYCLSIEALDAAGNITTGDAEICVQAGLQEPEDTGPFEGFDEPVTAELSGGSCPSGAAGLFLPLLLVGGVRRRR